jgi:hypothetical protein
MQDHSHRFLFLAATGLMCAMSVYGSQAGPTLLLPERFNAATADETSSSAPSAILAATHAQPIVFRTAEADAATEDVARSEEQTEHSSASVVPNDASCPADDAAALVSPPSVNGAIGSPTPIEKAALPREGLTGATLGTGSSCPPRHGVETARKSPSAAADSLNPKDRSALSAGVAGP